MAWKYELQAAKTSLCTLKSAPSQLSKTTSQRISLVLNSSILSRHCNACKCPLSTFLDRREEGLPVNLFDNLFCFCLEAIFRTLLWHVGISPQLTAVVFRNRSLIAVSALWTSSDYSFHFVGLNFKRILFLTRWDFYLLLIFLVHSCLCEAVEIWAHFYCLHVFTIIIPGGIVFVCNVQ